MNLHKQKLLKDFSIYNLPKELIDKVKSDDVNVYEAYHIINAYIHCSTKTYISIQK